MGGDAYGLNHIAMSEPLTASPKFSSTGMDISIYCKARAQGPSGYPRAVLRLMTSSGVERATLIDHISSSMLPHSGYVRQLVYSGKPTNTGTITANSTDKLVLEMGVYAYGSGNKVSMVLGNNIGASGASINSTLITSQNIF